MRKGYQLRDCQKGMVIGSITHPESTYYNNTSYICVLPRGAVDPYLLSEAIKKTINAHPCWKSYYQSAGGSITQIPNDKASVMVSVTGISDSELEIIKNDFVTPFDIFSYPLYKIQICHSSRRVYLLFSFHHSLFDVRSCMIFLQDISKAYEGIGIIPETFNSFDYSERERKSAGGEKYKEIKGFFDDYISGSQPAKLPPVPTAGKGVSMSRSVFFKYDEVSRFCTENKVSPNNLFTTALGIVVSHYTGDDDVLFFSTHHGRVEEGTENIAGMFVNTIPVKMKVSAGDSAGTLLSGVRVNMKELWTKQPFSFFDYYSSHKMEMNIVVNYQYKLPTELTIGGAKADLDYLRTDKSPIPFALYVFVTSRSFEVRGVYDDSLYSAEYMKEFMSELELCIYEIIKDPSRKVGEINLMGDDSRARILALSSGETIPLAKGGTFLSLFRERVRNNRDSMAVADSTGTYTYGELDDVSDRMAENLISRGLVRGDRVSVMLHRTKEYISTVISVMKAGGIFVPIDVSYPAERVSYTLQNSESRFLIKDNEEVVSLEPNEGGNTVNKYTDGAYMIYTSGSTGKPKGVVISHKSLYAFIIWMIRLLELKESDRITTAASFSFDASVLDSFPVLSAGAQLHVLSEDTRRSIVSVYDYIIEKGITGAFFTTMLAHELLKCYDLPIRYLGLGGERCPNLDYRPDMKIINMYGPTEFTVVSSYHILNDREGSEIPIGRPVPNSHAYVLDKYGRLLPEGVIGELHMSGIQISDGYFGKEELTAQKFVPNPYSTSDADSLMYKTGDLVRWGANGELEFMGRSDHQVKLRGYRIELEEIESVISQYPGITLSHTILYTKSAFQMLCSYFTADVRIDIPALSAYLSQHLTPYMVPTSIIQVDDFPVTTNGKIDNSRLPEPVIVREETVPPSSKNEKILCRIVRKILGSDDIGVTHDLFSLGIDSLQVMIISAQAEKEGVHISIPEIYHGKTIRKIINEDIVTKPIAYWESEYNPSHPVVVLVCGASPAPLIHSIIEKFSSRYSLLIVDFLEDHYNKELAGKDYREMTDLFMESLTGLMPEAGNRVLAFCGHCLGGEIAYAMAVKWFEKMNCKPGVWLFNSFAERNLTYPEPVWQLSEEKEMIWKNHQKAERMCDTLLRNRYMPEYRGRVSLFFTTHPTYNIASPDLPVVSDDPEVLKHIKEFFIYNPISWTKYASNMRSYPVDSDHWTIVAEVLKGFPDNFPDVFRTSHGVEVDGGDSMGE